MKGSDAMNFLFVLWCWITAFGLLGCGIVAVLEWRQAKNHRIATLESALRDLLEQIDCLDDIAFSKDTEPYKAEACWDDANRRARDVLKGAKP